MRNIPKTPVIAAEHKTAIPTGYSPIAKQHCARKEKTDTANRVSNARDIVFMNFMFILRLTKMVKKTLLLLKLLVQ